MLSRVLRIGGLLTLKVWKMSDLPKIDCTWLRIIILPLRGLVSTGCDVRAIQSLVTNDSVWTSAFRSASRLPQPLRERVTLTLAKTLNTLTSQFVPFILSKMHRENAIGQEANTLGLIIEETS